MILIYFIGYISLLYEQIYFIFYKIYFIILFNNNFLLEYILFHLNNKIYTIINTKKIIIILRNSFLLELYYH